ncbi:MAG: hypothetical protein E6X17_14415 [Sporomusaceae bacterium]|nr:hypothetical protein [Sporomusaceae bacterium]
MNLKLKKMIIAVTGSAFMLGGFTPLLVAPQLAAAMEQADPAQVEAVQSEATAEQAVTPEQQLAQTLEETVANKEVDITDGSGTRQRLAIAGAGRQTAAEKFDRSAAEKLQKEVERGKSQWLLNPVDVVKNNAARYGFNVKQDSFNLISQVSVNGRGKAYVLVGHGRQYYIVELTQPVGSGHKRIWQITSIREATVVSKPAKPDVGSGVAGLDYNKVIKWQQNVDAGRELWRLDPLQVAKNEGKQYYGFSDKARYTVTRKLSSSPIARHGQIDIAVTQNGKTYTMILVRPFGSDKGAIWTTYRVYGTAQPVQPDQSKERVLFKTDKYKNWQWYKSEYPRDMGVAVIYGQQQQLRARQQMPSSVLDELNRIDLTDKVALTAYLGGVSSRHDIGIERVTVKGSQMTVTVRTKSPQRFAADTRDLTYPADFVLVDRSLFTSGKTMNVSFVDQNGKQLGKVAVTIR